MNVYHNILPQFSPTALASIGKARLMDRRDTKFIFPEETLPDLLQSLCSDYMILEIDGKRAMHYETTYFDTPDFFHFQQHLSRRLTRYKVRYRKYLDTDCTFFEIKTKNNHERTYKERIQVAAHNDVISEPERSFLDQKSPLGNEILVIKLRVNYSRITLVNKAAPERVTIDTGLAYSHNGSKADYPRLVIAEVKQGGHGGSPFIKLMRKHKIRRFSLSKYCLGIITLNGDIKHNLYKYKLRYINRIIYDTQRNP